MLTEMLTELELRRKDRDADFLKLARKLAAGEKMPAAMLEKLLTECGKTPAELAAAVELATQRARWHEERRTAAALEKEQAAVQDRMAAEDRKLAAAEKAHEDATAPLLARLHEIRAAVSAAGDARRKLIDTCPYPALKAELAAVSDRLAELRAEAAVLRDRGELVKRAERDEETADRLAAGIVPFTSTARIDYWRELAQRNRAAGNNALAALATVQKEIAKLEREEAAVFERMTKP